MSYELFIALRYLRAKRRQTAISVITAIAILGICLLYTSDAADERSSVDLGGRRIIKKKKSQTLTGTRLHTDNNQWNSVSLSQQMTT